ncbi:MAG: diaminopimelate decarboxylase [Gammaproteobacteria bacterium]
MNPAFAYRDGQLYAEAVPLEEIAARFGTPCYVYSRGALEARYDAYVAAFAGRRTRVCYAVKANGNLAVLGVLAARGAGFDIVSGGELARVIAAGGDPRRVVFSGACKLDDEMRFALAQDIACFNVESAPELERLSELAVAAGRTAKVAIRVNPDVEAGGHRHISTGKREHKFGIALEDAGPLIARAQALPGMRLDGVACHIGSQMMALGPLASALEQLAQFVRNLQANGVPLTHVDAGGGLGIDHAGQTAPTPVDYAAVVIAALGDLDLDIVLEPGRSIAGPAGLLLTRTAYLKQGHGRKFALVDAAMNDLLRPALYEAWHDILPLRAGGAPDPEPIDVVGPVCETGDFLGRDRRLAVQAGELLAVADGGAYGFVMSSNYNARPRACEVMVAGAEARLVRRRETVEELWRGEALFEETPA